MEISLPVDLNEAVKALQQRVEQLEKDNARLRWQLAEGFRDSVRDFSDSLLDSLDPENTKQTPSAGVHL